MFAPFLRETWEVYPEHYGELGISIAVDGYGVAPDGIAPVATVSRWSDDDFDPRMQAYANLIAAAPDMFRILMDIYKHLDDGNEHGEMDSFKYDIDRLIRNIQFGNY